MQIFTKRAGHSQNQSGPLNRLIISQAPTMPDLKAAAGILSVSLPVILSCLLHYLDICTLHKKSMN